jgi:glycosyltransferase involved in cell wall biosynthesis
MQNVTVSAVIPAYNRERQIGRALASVTAQASPPDEIIVVDDGSSDGTAEAAAACGSSIRILHQANKGAGSARDRGLRAASGEWVAFLDSDDEWNPRYLEAARRAIAATAGIAVLYFADTQLSPSEGGRQLWTQSGLDLGPRQHELVPDGTEWALLPLHPMMLQSSIVHRKRSIAIGGFRTAMRGGRDDTAFLLAVSLGMPICAVNVIGAMMHEDADVRLGERQVDKSEAYWTDTVSMYRHLRARSGLRPATYAEVRQREVHGWIGLSNAAWKRGDMRACAFHALQAFNLAPAITVRRVAAKLRRSLPFDGAKSA